MALNVGKRKISFWEKIDMLGGKIGYKIDGQPTYKILLGGFMTIMITAIYLYFLAMILIPFVQRKVPRISFQNYKDMSPPPFKLKENGVLFAYKLSFMNKTAPLKFDLNEVFNVAVSYVTNSGNSTVERTINAQKSDISLFKGQESLYNKFNLADSYSLILDPNIQFKGSPVADEFSFLQINVFLKDNSFEFQEEVRKNYFVNYGPCTLEVFYLDLSLQFNNYTQPYSNFISYYKDSFGYGDLKISISEFSLISLKMENSYLFFENIDPIYVLMHQSSYTKINYQDSTEESMNKPIQFFSANLQYSKQRTDYVRSYMTIPELLSILGGNLYFLMYLFSLLYNYVNEYLFNVRLIEEIFELDKDGQGQFDMIQPKIKKKYTKFELVNLERMDDHSIKNISGHTHGNQTNNTTFQNQTAFVTNHNISHSNIQEEGRKKKKNSQPVPVIKRRRPTSDKSFYSAGDVCKQLFFCYRTPGPKDQRKKLMYDKAKNKLDTYMDILSVTKRLIEIDLLKYLIFNEDQFKVCSLIGKPYLSLEELNFNKSKFSHSYLDYADLKMKSNAELLSLNIDQKRSIKESFNKLLRKEKKSIIDQKLIISAEDNVDFLK